MKPLLKHSALVLFLIASTAHATGNPHGAFFLRYAVDLGARSADGTPIHPTFPSPYGFGPIPYEVFTVADDAAGTGSCRRVAATRFAGPAEQKMWIEATPRSRAGSSWRSPRTSTRASRAWCPATVKPPAPAGRTCASARRVP